MNQNQYSICNWESNDDEQELIEEIFGWRVKKVSCKHLIGHKIVAIGHGQYCKNLTGNWPRKDSCTSFCFFNLRLVVILSKLSINQSHEDDRHHITNADHSNKAKK